MPLKLIGLSGQRLRIVCGATLIATSANCAGPSADNERKLAEETPSVRAQLVYASQGRLWLHDISSNEHKELAIPTSINPRLPRFIRENAISYRASLRDESAQGGSDESRDAIHLFELATGKDRVVLQVDSEILSFDWTSDETRIASLTRDEREAQPHAVSVHDLATNRAEKLLTLGRPPGGDLSEEDQVKVEWAPDDDTLLVVDTHVSEASSDLLHVIEASGKELVPPLPGTQALWSLDGKQVYYRNFGARRDWQVLDVTTGTSRSLAMKPQTLRPRLSPDGGSVVYDDGSSNSSLFVFDLATGEEKRIGEGYVAGLWVSRDTVLATVVKECVPEPLNQCFEEWDSRGKTRGISLDNGHATEWPVTSSLDADVFGV